MGLDAPTTRLCPDVEKIPLSYDHENSEASALTLVFALRPEWEKSDGSVDTVKFTDGITNTVCEKDVSSQRWPADLSEVTQDLEKARRLV